MGAPPWAFDVTSIPFVQGGVWLLVAVLMLLRWRRIATILAWLAVTGSLARGLWEHPLDPTVLLREWPLLVFGVTVAGCLTFARGPVALRRITIGVFGGTAAACAGSLWLDAMIARVVIHDGGSVLTDHWGMNSPSVPGVHTTGALPLLLYLTFLIVTGWIVVRAGGQVRRRLLALAAVPLFVYTLVRAYYIYHIEHPVPLNVAQWAVLIILPPLTLGMAMIAVRRKDSQQRLIDLGRAHSKNVPAGEPGTR